MNRVVFSAVFLAILCLSGCGTDDPEVDCTLTAPGVVISESADPTCTRAGSLTASSSGGKSPVMYSIDGEDFQMEKTFEDLAAGTYTITAKDANDCTSSTSVTLTLQSDITLSLLTTEAGCGGSEGSLTIEAGGGSGDFTYSIDGSAFQSEPTFENLTDGLHVVVVKDGNCEVEAEAVVPSGISFENKIAPIITANCALGACHGGSQAPNFTVFANIQESAEQIKLRTANKSMPPTLPDHGQEPLTDEQIQAIACWVNDGAKEN